MSLFSMLFGSRKAQNSNVKILSATEFKLHLENKKVQLVDVRTAMEFNTGYIKNAKNIDFYSGKFNVKFNKLNKNQAVYLYCRSGSRSRQTAYKIEAMGFEEVYDLKGGLINFK